MMSNSEITYLDLTDEQSRLVHEADGPMDIRDQQGRLIGQLYPGLREIDARRRDDIVSAKKPNSPE